jgi:FKBP-type peptidyl-prolyl cis-trans isomerase
MKKFKRSTLIIIGVIVVAVIVLVVILVNVNKSEPNVPPIEESQTGDNNQNTNQMPEEQLKIEILTPGTGAGAARGDNLTVNYLGTLANGHKFDSSYDRKTPFKFQLGVGQVIEGWDTGLLGMKVGEKRKLTIPPELGYGNRANGDLIPANSTLIFTVELLKIN